MPIDSPEAGFLYFNPLDPPQLAVLLLIVGGGCPRRNLVRLRAGARHFTPPSNRDTGFHPIAIPASDNRVSLHAARGSGASSPWMRSTFSTDRECH